MLPRRADASRVVGVGLEVPAAGPAPPVCGWIRRFCVRVESVRSSYTMVLVALAWDPVTPEPCGSPLADAAVAAARAAARERWGLPQLERWSFACRASRGRILTVTGG